MSPIIVGNWKMNPRLSEALLLLSHIAREAERVQEIEVVICPPSVYIYPIFENLSAKPRNLSLGLQNTMWEDFGAYTGEVSLAMVKKVCKYVIIGHSERRRDFGETDESVNKKVQYCLKNGFLPIICVGELEKFHLEDYYAREVERMKKQGGILSQIDQALDGVNKKDIEKVTVCYEPIWAISGNGNAASGAYAAAVAYIIKSHLIETYGETLANESRVLYGGSVSAKNVNEYMMQPSIDGLLVGAVSLEPKEFGQICRIAAEVKSGRIV